VISAWKKGLIVFLLSVQPALACHHYRSWSYPWPQSCKVTSAHTLVHQRTWFVEIAPEPVSRPAQAPEVEDPAKAQAIETLKQELLWRAAQSLTMEEKRNGD
jgi:hypothetical protein